MDHGIGKSFFTHVHLFICFFNRFIDQIAKENDELAPTEPVWTTPAPAPQRRFQPRSMGSSRSGASRYGASYGSKIEEDNNNMLADKFAWFSEQPKPQPTQRPRPQQPVKLQSRSGIILGHFLSLSLIKIVRQN